MLIIAKTTRGTEYLYNAKSAHKVPQKHAQKIADIVNKYSFKLSPGECWYVYDVSEYENAAIYAQYARFTYGKNGLVKELTY